MLPQGVRAGQNEPLHRILSTAYELFSRRGIRDVGINELIERSGVAKSTFYRHFPSKDALVLAFLALRDQVWTVDLIVAEAMLAASRARGSSAGRPRDTTIQTSLCRRDRSRRARTSSDPCRRG